MNEASGWGRTEAILAAGWLGALVGMWWLLAVSGIEGIFLAGFGWWLVVCVGSLVSWLRGDRDGKGRRAFLAFGIIVLPLAAALLGEFTPFPTAITRPLVIVGVLGASLAALFLAGPMAVAEARSLLGRHDPLPIKIQWPANVALSLIALGATAWGTYQVFRPWIDAEPDPAAEARVAGCYEMELGRWLPPSWAWGGGERVIPAYVRLDTLRGPRIEYQPGPSFQIETGRRLIRPGWRGSAYWMATADDRILLMWTTGLGGVRAVLEPAREGFRGVARPFTDILRPEPPPRASVRARPTACSNVPPDSARAARAHLEIH